MPIEILYLLIGISIGIVVLLIYKSNVVSKDIYLELERKSHDLKRTPFNNLKLQNCQKSLTQLNRIIAIYLRNCKHIKRKLKILEINL